MKDGPPSPLRQPRRVAIAAGVGIASAAAVLLSRLPVVRRSWPTGSPLPVAVGDLLPGRLRTVEWQGKPVWILHRDAAMLAALAHPASTLADPASQASVQPPYAQNAFRSRRPEFFVAIGLCTHQGCVPSLAGARFLCPCHASKYDLAGRVFASGPAPANLTVPAYRFDDGQRLILGEDG